MLTKKKFYASILFAIGIVVLINIIGNRFLLRLDFTADKAYSLSDATKKILDNLDQPVTITAYFSENLPPNVAKVRRDFKDMLTEYNDRSGGMVVYEFVNPNKDRATEQKAQQSGIRPVMINVRERDQVKQQRAYLGAVIQYGNSKEVIPFIQPGSPIEYEISSNIKKLTVKDKPKLAILQGNGEPALSSMQQLTGVLNVTNDVSTIQFSDTSGVPAKYKTLAIIAPTDSIPNKYFKYLDEFLGRGGRLLLAVNRAKANFQTRRAEPVKTGLTTWLKKYGVEIGNNLVLDAKSSNVMVRQQQGMFIMNTPVSFPYIPIVNHFADFSITKGLEQVIFPLISSVNYVGKDSTVHVTKLAFSSDKAALKQIPLTFEVGKNWSRSDFPQSKITLALALEGNFVNNTKSKIVVIGDGDFAVNGEGQQAQKLQPDNINFMVNSIDWLSDDTGLNALRTKAITSRPLKADLDDGTRTLIKYLNFLLPIFLVLIYGFFRFRIKKSLRNKIESLDYGSK